MKKIVFILIFFLITMPLGASFENDTDTTFTRSMADIGEIFIDNNIINFTKNPANLALIQKIRYGIEYQNSYFENLFYRYNLYYSRKVKNLGLGIILSEFVADDEDFNYSEFSLKFAGAYKITSFINTGLICKFLKINSLYLDATGFNTDIGVSITTLKYAIFSIVWRNFLDSPLLWDNQRKEYLTKELSVSAGYKILYNFINANIILQYNLSDIKIKNFYIVNRSNDNIACAVITHFNRFYISGGISRNQKSFGLGIEMEYFIIYFSNNIKDVGSQQSINITFKGGF